MKLCLYPHFTVAQRGDLVAVTALVAAEKIYESGPLENGEHLVGGLAAPWLWAALTGHWWGTEPRTASMQTARSARAWLCSVATDPRYRLAWFAARDWGDQIWPNMVRPIGQGQKIVKFN